MVWGQIRRTTSPLLALSEVAVVYVAFLAASTVVDPRTTEPALASAGAGIAALSALVIVSLRDAWAGRGSRAAMRLVLDAALATSGAASAHAVLHTLGARVAFTPATFSFGCAAGLPLLAGVRVFLSRLPDSAVSADERGDAMHSTQLGQSQGMQRDLRLMFGTIAAIGFTAGIGLLLVPAVAPVRPLVVVWLVLFALIGIYQRSRTTWPQPLPADAGVDEIARYRTALERRRDEQHRWPAQRLRWTVGTIAMGVLVGVVGMLNPGSGISTGKFLITSIAVAVLGLGLYAFTRRMTNRAAADFQRALDEVPPPPPGRH